MGAGKEQAFPNFFVNVLFSCVLVSPIQGLHLVKLLTNVNLLTYAGRRNLDSLCMLIVCD